MSAAFGDVSDLSARLAAASGQPFQSVAADLVGQYSVLVAQLAQAYAPVKSGKLRDTITIARPDPLTAVIGPTQPYGSFQEFGTATRGEFGGSVYEIKPRKPGGWLRFTVGGRVVYARVVHHPGIPPHSYMRPAFERVITPFGQSLAQVGASYVVYGPYAPASRPTVSA